MSLKDILNTDTDTHTHTSSSSSSSTSMKTKKTKSTSTESRNNALVPYFREMSETKLLRAEQELELEQKLEIAERATWCELLAHESGD